MFFPGIYLKKIQLHWAAAHATIQEAYILKTPPCLLGDENTLSDSCKKRNYLLNFINLSADMSETEYL